jgi:hypothetical protein
MSVYNPHVEKVLMDAMQIPLKPSLHIAESTVRGIMGRVRTIVLEWSMKLEKRGVIGEGMTFSEKERKEAATIHVETLIQGVSGSQIQVHSPGAQQHQGLSTQQLTDIKTLVELVSKVLPSEPTQREDIRELCAEIETLRAQSESPKPKRSVLRESLGSVRAIIEGAAGELLASHLPEAIALVSGLLHSL